MKTVGEMNDSLVIHPPVQLLRKQFAKKAKYEQKNNCSKGVHVNLFLGH
jgi:hypothetical protein